MVQDSLEDAVDAAEILIPPALAQQTTRILVAGFVGGLLFSVGSACFVASSFITDWLPSFRAGCIIWIVGCLPYVYLSLLDVCSSRWRVLSVVLQNGGLGCYVVGCILGLLKTPPLVEINAIFAAGSASLTVDILIADAIRPRPERCGKLSNLQLLACAFFCLAAGFGGYSTGVALIRFGQFCWLIGSMILFGMAIDDWIKEMIRRSSTRAKVRGAGGAVKLALRFGGTSRVAPRPGAVSSA